MSSVTSERRVGQSCAAGVRPLCRIQVGTDMVSVSDVSDSINRFGERYVQRLFTADEAAYCRAATGQAAAERFAARFAAKEAVFKALQPDEPPGDWRAIEVTRRTTGQCEIVLHGEWAALTRRHGVESLALSMSHDHDRAIAVVVAHINVHTHACEER